MRLLITTQAVDLNDPALGFFHLWIEALAKECEQVHVICLKEGIHRLPQNVSVHSLGKETGRSRLKYVWRFYRILYALRKDYDAVFVHMNSEYVVLGGLFWRQWGKHIVLWRNHRLKGFSTWLAVHMADTVLYTSPSAYVARFGNAKRMPIGIDTETFAPAGTRAPDNSILFFGRLDEVKHPDVFVAALGKLYERGTSFSADIVGDPTHAGSLYAQTIHKAAGNLTRADVLQMRPSIANADAPELFRSHAIYVNLTPSGSFDKTIGEAASCGSIIVAANEVLRGILPDALIVDQLSAESVARGIEAALKLSADERTTLSRTLREYVVREHSLSLLARRLMGILTPH